jgi:hypothetical protein
VPINQASGIKSGCRLSGIVNAITYFFPLFKSLILFLLIEMPLVIKNIETLSEAMIRKMVVKISIE